MILQAALNGGRSLSEHPNVPVTPEQLAAAVKQVIDAGADTVHFHVRQADGSQSLAPDDVSRTLNVIRAACPDVALGISTSAAIVPDNRLRYDLVSQWTILPDYVSVNIHEAGSLNLMELLLSKGIGVEAGIWTADAARQLQASGLGDSCLRILIEATEKNTIDARATVRAIQTVLANKPLKPPILLHGENAPAWDLFYSAVAYGYDTRIGFEDMLTLPDGAFVESNADLIRFARRYIQLAERKFS